MSPTSLQDDPHLGTGAYDPATYWSARAAHDRDDALAPVCVFGATGTENRCADRVQRAALRRACRAIGVQGRSVLEYGCGVARWLPMFRALGATWSGVDLSPAMRDGALERHPDADVRVLEAGRIPHPDASFDVVYTVTVMHHNRYERQAEIMAELLRVLRPNGTLILLEDLGETRTFNMFPRSPAGWAAFAAEHGLRQVAARGLRYWVLRSLLARWRRKPGVAVPVPAAPGVGRRSMARRVVDRLDMLIDPWLQRWLPTSSHTAALMVFRRSEP